MYSPIQNGSGNHQGHERRIVAVVGTAHVRGMCKEWAKLKGDQTQPSIAEFLS